MYQYNIEFHVPLPESVPSPEESLPLLGNIPPVLPPPLDCLAHCSVAAALDGLRCPSTPRLVRSSLRPLVERPERPATLPPLAPLMSRRGSGSLQD